MGGATRNASQPHPEGAMKRVLLLCFFALPACAQSPIQTQAAIFNPQPWLDDFRQLLNEMSAHYANLEWDVENRKMDLPRLRLDTEANLRAAASEADARRVFEKFLSSFGDGHLELRWPKNNASPADAAAAPQSLCTRMGYNSPLHPGLDFAQVPGFSTLDTPESSLFPGGLLRLQNHAVLGILRIALFSEHAYPQICRQAARDLHIADNAQCDDKCGDQLETATANLLTAALVKRADALRSAGATKLLIDITHNGGGSDWVEAVPRALSAVPLQDSKMAFIKHPHWTTQLQDRLHDVQTDIKNHANSPIPLNAAVATLEKAIEASRQSCDRSAVWTTGKLTCSLLVKDLLFTSGIVPYAKPGSLASLASKTDLFQPSQYSYSENPKALPLVVVVDRNTWSAAEYFAAMLQDNHAATVIGEVTGGAGCGYTNGGIPAQLKNSAAPIKMPDCVRFRAGGMNEVNGVKPDVLLPWSGHDSDFQRVTMLLSKLQ